MASRRTFLPRPLSLKRRGTVERRGSGLVEVAVQPRRPWGQPRPRRECERGGATHGASRLESTRKKSSAGRQRDVRTANRHRWARRVASGERVKRGQGTRHNDPVTSEEGMPPRVTCTRELEGVAVNRPKRLFSKNTGACQAAQGAVYALTPARCRKVKGRG